jgi:hypothetical protein
MTRISRARTLGSRDPRHLRLATASLFDYDAGAAALTAVETPPS